ncbi:T9SS type A sorting domain-containing protein [Ekhidna sp.]|uniref:T9SS type A sorting domain-containing protein n=1 Tax=Ekhidna sp. TaxID=2608089 RepID=UPI0032EEC1D6
MIQHHIKILILFAAMHGLAATANAQLSLQGYSTGIAGGVSSSTNYSTEVSTGEVGGKPKGENYGFYLGLPAINLKSAVIDVRAVSNGNVLSDNTDGYLLKTKQSGNYDTLDIAPGNESGSFTFSPVFHGDYLVVVDSDPEKYVPTYYSDAFLWDEADVLVLNMDTTARVRMTAVPPERNETTGDGKVSGTIEENFADEEGRILARRRAAKRKCGLRRKTGGGRTGQDNDQFELIAYGETNANGEFEYGFLPQGTYRFFVEYPGIPLDESSFVQFDVGEAGVGDNEFVLAAVVTETGITVELILGITSEFFTDFSIYPNPTARIVNIKYDKILSDEMSMQLFDMNGKILLTRELKKGKNGQVEVNIENYPRGQYILKFIDSTKGKTALTFRIIKQ